MALAGARAGSAALVPAGAAELPAELEGFDAYGSGTTAQVLRGDVEVVRARREACRSHKRSSAAVDEELVDAELRSARPTVDRATLDSDIAPSGSLGRMGCEKSAEHLRGAERAWDDFASAHGCAPGSGEYPAVDDVKRFAASMTRTRKRLCLAQRESDGEPARPGVGRTSSTNWLRQVRRRARSSRGGGCVRAWEGQLGCRERRVSPDGARALLADGAVAVGRQVPCVQGAEQVAEEGLLEGRGTVVHDVCRDAVSSHVRSRCTVNFRFD